jgi:hypothetical protein
LQLWVHMLQGRSSGLQELELTSPVHVLLRNW